MRYGCRLGVVVGAVLVTSFVLIAPAFAHAELERSSPAAGSVLQRSPHQISLTFGESVIASGAAIRLYDDRLSAVPIGAVRHLEGHGDLVGVDLPRPLRTGTYVVTWRVTSADTHVVSGSFTFSVGHATALSGAPPANGRDPTTSHLAAIVRGFGYAGLVAGPGALVVIAWLWPTGLGRRRVQWLLAGGVVLLVAGTLASVVLQGAAAAGVSVGDAFDGSTLQLGMAGRFGRAVGARLVLVIAMAELAILGRRRGRVSPVQVSIVLAALTATWPYAGHSGTGDLAPLAFVADWAHIAAMATWLGGIAMLLVGPLAGKDPRADPPLGVTAAFSEWALNAVTLLVATGLFSAWRNVRSFGALTATHYGHLLLWKSAFVLVLLAIARVSRRQAAQRSGEATVPLLRRAVGAEAFGAAVILGITGFLTGAPLASQTYAPAFTRSATTGGLTVTVHVDRTGVGQAHLLVSAARAGTPQRIAHITGSLTEVNPPIGPLPVTFAGSALGREAATVTFPSAGDWSLQLRVQTSSITAVAVETTIHVR